MGRSPCCDESGLKKGPWTPEEDQKLVKHIQKHGHGSWRALPKLAGLNRCGKSCRLRWTNYLRPDIKRGKFTPEEEQTILNLHSVLGNKWSAIATHLPGRTDNEIKNFWNTHLKKKLIQMGFDPMTHRPRTDIFSSLPHLIALANLKELLESQSWEEQAVRLQTEAAQMAKLQYLQYLLQPPPNNFTNNIASEMDTYSLLNSLSSMKDSDNDDENNHNLLLSTNQFETHDPNLSSSSSLQSLQDTINFSHMPDLQIPCSFQTLVDKDQDNMVQPYSHHETRNSSPSTSPWFPSTSSPTEAHLMITETNSITTNTTTGGGGDACSTNSSYEGGLSSSSPFWPEVLLEDTLFNELD